MFLSLSWSSSLQAHVYRQGGWWCHFCFSFIELIATISRLVGRSIFNKFDLKRYIKLSPFVFDHHKGIQKCFIFFLEYFYWRWLLQGLSKQWHTIHWLRKPTAWFEFNISIRTSMNGYLFRLIALFVVTMWYLDFFRLFFLIFERQIVEKILAKTKSVTRV